MSNPVWLTDAVENGAIHPGFACVVVTHLHSQQAEIERLRKHRVSHESVLHHILGCVYANRTSPDKVDEIRKIVKSALKDVTDESEVIRNDNEMIFTQEKGIVCARCEVKDVEIARLSAAADRYKHDWELAEEASAKFRTQRDEARTEIQKMRRILHNIESVCRLTDTSADWLRKTILAECELGEER